MFGKKREKGVIVDTDIVAFHVSPDMVDELSEMMVAEIIAFSVIQFGETPEIMEDIKPEITKKKRRKNKK